MRGLGPEFIDITWNAGGRTSDLTSELVKTCQKLIGVETCMHLTCTNMPKDKVDIALRVRNLSSLPFRSFMLTQPSRPSVHQEAKAHGCRNILALRGDPPAGQDEWSSVEGGFEQGIDLVRHIRKHYGDYFDIAIAGFPQQLTLPPEEFAQEMQWLKEKCEAGVNFIFTQMFYDVDMFINWVKEVRKAGITIPIVPGINPIQTWNGFLRSTQLSQTIIPKSYMDQFDPIKNDDEKVRALGTKLVAELCRKILAADIGIKGLHFYTMNLEKGTKMLLEELNFVPRIETLKPLPWRQVRSWRRFSSEVRAHDVVSNYFFVDAESHAFTSYGNYSSYFLGESYKIVSLPN
jgi:methylenetetrahydrofolate reductase (NADPH)